MIKTIPIGAVRSPQTFLVTCQSIVFWTNSHQRTFCELLSQDLIGLKMNLVFSRKESAEVGRFSHFSGYLPPSGCTLDKVLSRMQKARLAFTTLRHPWRRRLPIKGRVYATTMRWALLYGFKTLPLIAEDMWRFSAFEHCLRIIDRIPPVTHRLGVRHWVL